MANPWLTFVKAGWPAAKKKGMSYAQHLKASASKYKKKKGAGMHEKKKKGAGMHKMDEMEEKEMEKPKRRKRKLKKKSP